LATDYARLRKNLTRFYDFSGKTVLFIGAGGKQLLDPASQTKKLIAVDKDAQALLELQAKIGAEGLQDSMEAVCCSFEDVTLHADVVYFEFCLHEMDDPETALVHAKSLAPDIVVYDHTPGSEWIYYGAEEKKVAHSFATMERLGIRRREEFRGEQQFGNYSALLTRVTPQGPVAIERAQRFAGATNIVIPMRYELNLL